MRFAFSTFPLLTALACALTACGVSDTSAGVADDDHMPVARYADAAVAPTEGQVELAKGRLVNEVSVLRAGLGGTPITVDFTPQGRRSAHGAAFKPALGSDFARALGQALRQTLTRYSSAIPSLLPVDALPLSPVEIDRLFVVPTDTPGSFALGIGREGSGTIERILVESFERQSTGSGPAQTGLDDKYATPVHQSTLGFSPVATAAEVAASIRSIAATLAMDETEQSGLYVVPVSRSNTAQSQMYRIYRAPAFDVLEAVDDAWAQLAKARQDNPPSYVIAAVTLHNDVRYAPLSHGEVARLALPGYEASQWFRQLLTTRARRAEYEVQITNLAAPGARAADPNAVPYNPPRYSITLSRIARAK